VHILLFFVDGLGLGKNDPKINPIKNLDFQCLNSLLEDKFCIPTDAQLDVEGLPQSATGQTAILTGINAAKAVGRHINGFPTKTLKKLIKEHSILKRLKDKELKVTNANMYTKEYLARIWEYDNKINASATTLATSAAQIPFRLLEDMLKGKAVYQDITNELLIKRGFDVPLRTPHQAGKILAKLSAEYHFVLFEYFQTDLAGHSQDKNWCISVLRNLNDMLEGLMTNIDFKDSLLIFTSDHGNIEDISVSTHTNNKVPTVFKGRNADRIAIKIRSITDLASGIEVLLSGESDKIDI